MVPQTSASSYPMFYPPELTAYSGICYPYNNQAVSTPAIWRCNILFLLTPKHSKNSKLPPDYFYVDQPDSNLDSYLLQFLGSYTYARLPTLLNALNYYK